MSESYSLVTKYRGYINKADITNVDDSYLVPPSQNVIVNDGEKIVTRNGYSLFGAANTALTPILSSYDWSTSTNVERNLRKYDTKLEYYYSGSWRTLDSSLFSATATLNFRPWWDVTEAKDLLLFVDGTTNLYMWSGGVTTYASSTTNTITKEGTNTWAQDRFLIGGTRSVILNGTTYTYTGGEGTTTLTGVTPDPTSATVVTSYDTGVTNPGTAADDTSAGTAVWADTSNILSSNDAYSTVYVYSSTVIDGYAETNQDATVQFNATVTGGGQTFIPTFDSTLLSCKFYLHKTGTPTGNAVAKIYATVFSGGSNYIPTGAALATSDNVAVSGINTTPTFSLITFTFSGANQITLSSGTRYAVTFEHSGDASNHLNYGVDNSSSSHSGNRVTLTSGTWSASSIDTCFYITAVDYSTSHYLKATNFGFAIPSTATIVGIKAEIEQKSSGILNTESAVKIVKSSGTIGTTNKSTGAAIPTVDTYVTYGGSSDLWGESWTYSDINNSNFGVVFAVSGDGTVSVDHVRITVYYSTSVSGHTAGDVIVQSIRTTANVISSSVTLDIIEVSRNQVYLIDYNIRDVYVSKNSSYTDYTFSSPRLPGEGALLTLDSPGKAFAVQEEDVYVASNKNDWYKTSFTLSSDLTKEKLEIKKLKSGTGQAAHSQSSVCKVKNSVAYFSSDRAIDTLGRVENINTPQAKPLSDPIKTELLSYDLTVEPDTVFYRNQLWITFPSEQKVLIYDFEREFWQPPQTLPVRKFAIIDGVLCGHSSATAETYTLNDGTNDVGFAINSIAAFSYRNYGKRAIHKDFDEWYTEGYISSNTTLNLTLNFDYGGSRGVIEKDIQGDNEEIIFDASVDNSLGKNPLGSEPIGSTTESADDLVKFRVVNNIKRQSFFEIQPIYSSNEIDYQWEILANGPNIAASTLLTTQIQA